MKKLYVFVMILFFVSCSGYKPLSHYAKKVLGENIYATVIFDKANPKNSILIQDAINEAIVTKFNATLSKDVEATNLIVKVKDILFNPIGYDNDGYVISYQTVVKLSVKYNNKESLTKGLFDFPIDAQARISDIQQFEAIKEASLKALDDFVSKIGVEGAVE